MAELCGLDRIVGMVVAFRGNKHTIARFRVCVVQKERWCIMRLAELACLQEIVNQQRGKKRKGKKE